MPSPVARLTLAALVLALAAPSTKADELLRFKFKAGQSVRYEFVQAMKMNLEAAGRNSETEMTQTMEMTWKIKSVDDQGTATIEQTIDRIAANIVGPGANISYDSAKKDTAKQENPQAQQLVKLFGILLGAQITQELTALGEVKNVKLPEGLSDKLREVVAAGGAGNAMFSEDSIKNMSLQSGLKLPSTPIAQGKAWENIVEIPAPPLGAIKTVNSYTLKSTSSEGSHEIAVDGKMTLEKNQEVGAEIALDSEPITGVIHFDGKNGNIADSKVDQKFKMTVSAGNQNLVQTLAQVITLKRLP
jgi:hypothetical protein